MSMKSFYSWRMLFLCVGLSAWQAACSGSLFQGSAENKGSKSESVLQSSDESSIVKSWQAFLDAYPQSTTLSEFYEGALERISSRLGNESYRVHGYDFANMQSIIEDALSNPHLRKTLAEATFGDFDRNLDAGDVMLFLNSYRIA